MFNLDNPVLRSYLFYSGLLGLKMLATAMLTTRARYTRNVFINEEDAKFANVGVKINDPVVERQRRAHLNDLENIPVFWVLAVIYVTTGPNEVVAVNLFRIFTALRFIHTLVYAIAPQPQPTRALVFVIPFLISIFIGLQIIFHYVDSF